MVVLVAGVMYLNPFRDSLVVQRERALAVEAQLIAEVLEASLSASGPEDLGGEDGGGAAEVLSALSLSEGVDVFIYALPGTLVTSTESVARNPARPVRGARQRAAGYAADHGFFSTASGRAFRAC